MAKQIKFFDGSGSFYGDHGDDYGQYQYAPDRTATLYTVPSGRVAKILVELISVNDSTGITNPTNGQYSSFSNYATRISIGNTFTYWQATQAANGSWGCVSKVLRPAAFDTGLSATFLGGGTGIHRFMWGGNGGTSGGLTAPGELYLNAGEGVVVGARPLNNVSTPYRYRFMVIEEY